MNIRVVRESGGIGDIVRIIPALRGLREKHPDAGIWLYAPEEYFCLLRGQADVMVNTPRNQRRPRNSPLDEKRWPYLSVPSVQWDLSVDLYCPAFDHERRSRGEVWYDRIDLFCQAAGLAPNEPRSRTPVVNLDPADAERAQEFLRSAVCGQQSPLVALQPFSTDPARNWPLERWIELSKRLVAAGCATIIMDGCLGRTRGLHGHRVLAQPLGFVAALISQCDLLVGPDSGLPHLAAAVGTPGIGLFASQSGPLMFRHYPQHDYVYPDWDERTHCRWPCFWERRAECLRAELQKVGRCCPMLERITVDQVVQAALARLAEGRRQPALPIGADPMPADVAAGCVVLRIQELPIPQRDFSLLAVALARGSLDLRADLREAYRVLRPDGELWLAAGVAATHTELIESEGFEIHAWEPGIIICRKVGTYPLWQRSRASSVPVRASSADECGGCETVHGCTCETSCQAACELRVEEVGGEFGRTPPDPAPVMTERDFVRPPIRQN